MRLQVIRRRDVRRVRPSDSPQLQRYYEELSAESRYARFLGFVARDSASTRSFCTPDHMHEEGFVAIVIDDRGERIVGHLCLAGAGAGRVELAVSVSDAFQGRGIGRLLMDAAIEWAQAHHVEFIVASAFTDNVRVLRLLESAPHGAHCQLADAGMVDVLIPLVGDLPADQSVVVPPNPRRASSARTASARNCCRVVWRRTPRPAPGAGGSASRVSS